MSYPRASGILLHPSSLPGLHGIGDLGPEAYRFVDWLAQSRQSLWQVLPLGPTGYGDSPYQSFSAFAGNPLLISLDRLVEDGLLVPADLAASPAFPQPVDFGAVIPFKLGSLQRAFARLDADAGTPYRGDLAAFCQQQAHWLDDYALFMALKEVHGGRAWTEWDGDVARRHPAALERWRRELAPRVRFHQVLQFLFDRQWSALKAHVHARRIQIIGDVPIFVAHDSADVWVHPELFHLAEDGRPAFQAGVPPDYFSATGQLWGNPLYRWDVLAQTGYAWWVERFRAALGQVDLIRLDHFRGFLAAWHVPAGETTAVRGEWVPGPGEAFFEAVRAALGNVPMIAEDLGVITPDVVALRDKMGYPGMKVLQFAFDSGPTNAFLPHGYERNCVVYTGTHDNDTTVGWLATCTEGERTFLQQYLGFESHDDAWDLIRLALSSVANQAVVPLQDVLGLGGEARMNYPGRLGGNWAWRYRPEQLTDALSDHLGELTVVYGRA